MRGSLLLIKVSSFFSSYAFKRIATAFFTLWVIITLTFFLMKMIPGDPFTEEKALPKEVLDSLYRYYKLDQPMYIQYTTYLKGILKADLGPSLKYKNRTASQIIKETFPVSAALGLEALLLSVVFGVLFGSLSAMKQHQWEDYSCTLLAILYISIPSFLLATFLQYLFAIKLNLLPVARWGTIQQSILPALSLSAMPTAFITRMLRTSLLDVLSSDYIKTAQAKGFSKAQVIQKHALKNALLPLVSYLSFLITNILTGSFVVEKIFGIPGLGSWLINSVSNRDYPIIMGLTIFYSALLVSLVLLVDLSYTFLDPRIRLNRKK